MAGNCHRGETGTYLFSPRALQNNVAKLAILFTAVFCSLSHISGKFMDGFHAEPAINIYIEMKRNGAHVLVLYRHVHTLCW
jgi:hypothetical protein